jgi:hypothetical protein
MKRCPTLVFEGGTLIIELEGFAEPGRGRFAFSEDDLEPVRDYDEDGRPTDAMLANLDASELLAIRDFLNEWLPPVPAENSAADNCDGEASQSAPIARDDPSSLPPKKDSESLEPGGGEL